MEMSINELIVLEYIQEEPYLTFSQVIRSKANQELTSIEIRDAVWSLLDRGIVDFTSCFRLYPILHLPPYSNWQRELP